MSGSDATKQKSLYSKQQGVQEYSIVVAFADVNINAVVRAIANTNLDVDRDTRNKT